MVLNTQDLSTDPHRVGAGGNWPRDEETDDPLVAPQKYENSCGPACGARTIAMREIETDVGAHELEEVLYDIVGRTTTTETLLAQALTEVTSIEGWDPGLIPEEGNVAILTEVLNRHTPWIAHMREWCSMGLGHFVVVVDINPETVRVNDPWNPGTSYLMSISNFVYHWAHSFVWIRVSP